VAAAAAGTNDMTAIGVSVEPAKISEPDRAALADSAPESALPTRGERRGGERDGGDEHELGDDEGHDHPPEARRPPPSPRVRLAGEHDREEHHGQLQGDGAQQEPDEGEDAAADDEHRR
jgi:hypothetical protein